jgi:hypothetical protein
MGLHGNKKFLHKKTNGYQIEEDAHRMRENLCQLYNRQGLVIRIYRDLKNLNSPQINDLIKKWEKELYSTFSSEEAQMDQKCMKKCSTPLTMKEMQI